MTTDKEDVREHKRISRGGCFSMLGGLIGFIGFVISAPMLILQINDTIPLAKWKWLLFIVSCITMLLSKLINNVWWKRHNVWWKRHNRFYINDSDIKGCDWCQLVIHPEFHVGELKHKGDHKFEVIDACEFFSGLGFLIGVCCFVASVIGVVYSGTLLNWKQPILLSAFIIIICGIAFLLFIKWHESLYPEDFSPPQHNSKTYPDFSEDWHGQYK